MKESVMRSSKLHDTSFIKSDLTRAVFDGSDCLGTDFTEANLTKATFREAEIDESVFDGAILKDTTWSDYRRCRASSIGICK
jgi:uncharacterized protein YjbI with pentapeptide repeats